MYVISMKRIKNSNGKPCDEWVYAGVDEGSRYPCWGYSILSCKRFHSIKEAKEWFEKYKSFLFGTYYHDYEFDKSTLGIRAVVYKKVASLRSNID